MYFKKFINDTEILKAKDTTKILSESTKGALVGAGVGGTIGLAIGFVKKKNILFSVMLGSVLGAALSRSIKLKFKK
jgi:outer membrane lipoprotein SlyB